MPYVAPGKGKTVWVLGDLYTFKASGEETGGAYAFVECLVQPQNGPPPHIHHREDETFYILQGEFSFLHDRETITATAGAFVRVPRGVLHTFKNVGCAQGKFLVHVAPAGLEKFFEEFGEPAPDPNSPPPPGPPDMEKLMRLCEKYAIELKLG